MNPPRKLLSLPKDFPGIIWVDRSTGETSGVRIAGKVYKDFEWDEDDSEIIHVNIANAEPQPKTAYLLSIHRLNTDKIEYRTASESADRITQRHSKIDPSVYATVAHSVGDTYEAAIAALAAWSSVQSLIETGRLDHLTSIEALRRGLKRQ